MRWVLWYFGVPVGYLLGGVWRQQGLPPLDISVLVCLFLSVFADRRLLPLLLLGAAVGRAFVDPAGLAVQILVLGIPVAVLLPLRTLLFGQHWVWQALAASLCALAIPKLGGLCTQWLAGGAGSQVQWLEVLWAALLLPPMLALVRRLPPFRAFVEAA